MADYTSNPWILDEIAANRKWMVEMMDGMPIECLTSCAKEIESLRAELAKRTAERDEARLEVRALQKKIGDTSIMLYDWDGYYNPHSQSGNIVEMAKLVEEAYSALQGRSWNEEKA